MFGIKPQILFNRNVYHLQWATVIFKNISNFKGKIPFYFLKFQKINLLCGMFRKERLKGRKEKEFPIFYWPKQTQYEYYRQVHLNPTYLYILMEVYSYTMVLRILKTTPFCLPNDKLLRLQTSVTYFKKWFTKY